MPIDGKTVLITGGNSGIGRATAEALARQGATVVITARDPSKGAAAAEALRKSTGGAVDWMPLDLSSFRSIERFADEFLRRYRQLQVLVNNAGLILSERVDTEDGFEMTFGVNHLGHFQLTRRLLPRLQESAPARIINLSSEAHRAAPGGLDFDDLQTRRGYGAYKAYGRSKLANILFTRTLAKRLAGTGIRVDAVHPGVVLTGFSLDGDARGFVPWFYRLFGWLLKKPGQGADTVIYLATDEALPEVPGGYYIRRKLRQPTRAARDDAAAERLWSVSEDLCDRALAALLAERPRRAPAGAGS